MMANAGRNLYRLNLIRDLREKELKLDRRNRLSVILGLGCFGFFILSMLYSGLTILQMENVLTREKDKVEGLQQEYRKYTAAKLIVDKSDIELLNELQGKGVFWTRKLASMAKHLPENYWITAFSFNNQALTVQGFGYANSQQDQLLILDKYLNELRRDTSFSDTFGRIQLNLADRKENNGKVSFEFSAFTGKGGSK
jgi:Tfp pilus assembly protein PilN